MQQVVLITGGSAGIGLAVAREFAKHGYNLLLVARQTGPLESAALELRDRFAVQVHTLALDVTSADAIDRISEKLSSSNLFVSHLINNAGTWLGGSVADADMQKLEQVMRANVSAVHAITRAVLPDMIKRGQGAVLNVGSLAGMLPTPGFALYSASKAFIHSMTMALREEIRGSGVSVSLLAPGVVRTTFVGPTSGFSFFSFLASSPQTVARAAYLGMQSSQGIIVPGLFWRIVRFGLQILPRQVSARILRTIALVSLARPIAEVATRPSASSVSVTAR